MPERTRPDWTKRRLLLDHETFATAVATAATQAQLAATFGVSRNTIQRRMQEWDLRRGHAGSRPGANHPCWTGGRRLGKHGYLEIWCPLHPHAKVASKSVPEHRLIMEVVLGRPLLRSEVIHHRDNHPRHNWPTNLVVYPNNAAHLKAELTGRVKATPRASIPGAYQSHQSNPRCPDARATLGDSFLEMGGPLAFYIESFRPTSAHRTQTYRTLLRAGAWRHPFQSGSTA